jgi:hypothetical protein
MSPDKGAPSSKTYAVEIVVPEGGRRLEDMHDFHHQRHPVRLILGRGCEV